MTTKTKNGGIDEAFQKASDKEKRQEYAWACYDQCFFIKKEAYYRMMGVYRSVYREGYNPPLGQFIGKSGKEYYRFFGNEDEYLEFKSHFWEPEWDNYFYY